MGQSAPVVVLYGHTGATIQESESLCSPLRGGKKPGATTSMRGKGLVDRERSPRLSRHARKIRPRPAAPQQKPLCCIAKSYRKNLEFFLKTIRLKGILQLSSINL
jgi:hypothetical protein